MDKRPRRTKEELSQEPFAEAMMDAINNDDPNVVFRMLEVGETGHTVLCRYSDFLSVRPDEALLMKKALSGFQAPRVLDIGCGVGRHLKFVREIKPTAVLTGVEIATLLRNECAKELPDAKFFSRFEEVPSEKAYDLILLMGNGLGVFGTEDITRQGLRRICRLLSDDGWLMLESGNSFGFTTRLHQIEYKGKVGPEFAWGYASESWVQGEMKNAGFLVPSISPIDRGGPFFLCCARKGATLFGQAS